MTYKQTKRLSVSHLHPKLSSSVFGERTARMAEFSSHRFLFLIYILTLLSRTRLSTGWFFSSNRDAAHTDKNQWRQSRLMSNNMLSEFSMEALNDDGKGLQLIENARAKMLAPTSCWQAAYQNMFRGCSKTLADEESRSRLAWHLSDCFQRHTGRQAFPACNEKSSHMKKCLQNLDRDEHQIYLEYFLETNTICHQLQSEAFRSQTERLVNELKVTAENAEQKLEKIEEHGELLLQGSKQVHDSLVSIDQQTQQVAQTSRTVEGHVNSVLRYSEQVYDQTKELAASQAELSQGQARMKENLAEGMAYVRDSHENLGQEISNLRNEAAEIEREISRVGEEMFSKMRNLRSKTEDIWNVAGSSLDKQIQLLDGQSVAIEGLNFLTKFQSQALEESRLTLQQMTEFGHKQQEELLQKQKQLHHSHDHLVENSKLILAAQEAFESKQATMFLAIDKLFSLHSAMRFESQVLFSFFTYSIGIYIVYMLTSIKQAYNVRHKLYLGLCVTFLTEISILWYTTEAEKQRRFIRAARSAFGLLASLQYLYAIFTHRDYEVLNHHMLLTLMEKVNAMQGAKEMLVKWEDDTEFDSEVNWSKWVDSDLLEDECLLEDPDYLLPLSLDSSSCTTTTTTNRYNLRRRS